MSFPNRGRFFQPDRGRKIQPMSATDINADVYSRTLSEAARSSWNCIKDMSRDLGVNLGTAKNIWQAKNGGSGVTLIKAMRESDEVLFAILELAGRADMVKRAQAMQGLEAAKAAIDSLVGVKE